jgi:hypothetical protein
MSQRIDDALKVLGLIRDAYHKDSSRSIERLRSNAIDKVAIRGVDSKTVFAHLVGKNVPSKLSISIFDRLLKLWLEESSLDLKKWYLLEADYFDRRNIEIFFNVPAVQNIDEKDSSSNLIKELEELKPSYEHLPETEREAIIQSRIGQGMFRTDLIGYWDNCAVTGCKNHKLLRASHIKPWSESNNIEMLDTYNGLLLIPNLDIAFDNGLISFENDRKTMISKLLYDEDRVKLGLNYEMRIRKLDNSHIKYLEYHRMNVFK